MRRYCSGCFFADVCPERHVCEDYSPIDEEEDSELLLQSLLGWPGYEFLDDWLEYVDEWK